jgi:MFS family permease
MSTSLIGDGILLVALAWQVYALSGATAAMSVVGFALTLPQVATLLFGGVVSDRFDRRKIMLGTDLVRGAVLSGLAALSLTGLVQVWHIVALVAVYGAASGFFGPAFDSLVPTLVDDEELTRANALDQFVRPAALQMAGPSLGGVLIAVGGSGLALAVDAATFAVSAACLLLMRSRPVSAVAEDSDISESSVWGEFKEGMNYVRGNVWLWGTFVAATFAYLLFIGPTEVLLPFVVKNELHGTAGDLGLVLASGGIGAIAAALIVGQRGVPREYMRFIYITWTLATLAVAGYGMATASWHLAISCALVNGLEAAGTIAWATAKQRLVPAELMGRVSSVDWFISIALVPLSYALAAPVANAIGVQNTLVGAGVLGAAVTFAFLYVPGMRSPNQLVVTT